MLAYRQNPQRVCSVKFHPILEAWCTAIRVNEFQKIIINSIFFKYLKAKKQGFHLTPILSVAVMSQIGILTPDWSITAVPCYSPEWKIAFGVNDEANKTRVCSKITSWNNFFLKYVINNDILQLCLQKIPLF